MFYQIAVIGTGSMGSMMAILFAEQNCFVSIFDPSKKSRDLAMQNAKEAGFVSKTKRNDRVKAYEDYASLCDSLAEPKVFLLSVPHGTVGDSIVEQLHPYLKIGDIIIDGSNEHWDNTQRRQAKAALRGVGYIGMGVSGGYQAAREGPSLSPGGDDATLNTVMPLLQKVAARDLYNKPCVTKIGPGGSGHYVKMIHNGRTRPLSAMSANLRQLSRYRARHDVSFVRDLGHHDLCAGNGIRRNLLSVGEMEQKWAPCKLSRGISPQSEHLSSYNTERKLST